MKRVGVLIRCVLGVLLCNCSYRPDNLLLVQRNVAKKKENVRSTVNECHRALKWLSYALVNFLQAFDMVVLSNNNNNNNKAFIYKGG